MTQYVDKKSVVILAIKKVLGRVHIFSFLSVFRDQMRESNVRIFLTILFITLFVSHLCYSYKNFQMIKPNQNIPIEIKNTREKVTTYNIKFHLQQSLQVNHFLCHYLKNS